MEKMADQAVTEITAAIAGRLLHLSDEERYAGMSGPEALRDVAKRLLTKEKP